MQYPIWIEVHAYTRAAATGGIIQENSTVRRLIVNRNSGAVAVQAAIYHGCDSGERCQPGVDVDGFGVEVQPTSHALAETCDAGCRHFADDVGAAGDGCARKARAGQPGECRTARRRRVDHEAVIAVGPGIAVGDDLAINAEANAQPVVATGNVDGGARNHAGSQREAPFKIGIGHTGQDAPHGRIEPRLQRGLQLRGGEAAEAVLARRLGVEIAVGCSAGPVHKTDQSAEIHLA